MSVEYSQNLLFITTNICHVYLENGEQNIIIVLPHMYYELNICGSVHHAL